MKKVERLFCIAAVCMAAVAANAQDKVEGTIATDLVNQYIWRGQDCGDVSVQPTLGVAYKGFSLTAWGNVGISDPSDTKEFDLTLAYTTGGFHVGVTDYWVNKGVNNYSGDAYDDAKYFSYGAHSTLHVYEANVGYDFGPVALNWYTNFAGNDGLNKSGKRAYSSYVEATAPFKLASLDWTATVGAVPYATSSYSRVNGFAVTNLGLKASKAIEITKSFSVPVFAGITANPSTQKAYFICGFTLQP